VSGAALVAVRSAQDATDAVAFGGVAQDAFMEPEAADAGAAGGVAGGGQRRRAVDPELDAAALRQAEVIRGLEKEIRTLREKLDALYAKLDDARMTSGEREEEALLRVLRHAQTRSSAVYRDALMAAALALRKSHPLDNCLVVYMNFNRLVSYHPGASPLLCLCFERTSVDAGTDAALRQAGRRCWRTRCGQPTWLS
jgi:Skp family chaperone for outer membrane proteins